MFFWLHGCEMQRFSTLGTKNNDNHCIQTATSISFVSFLAHSVGLCVGCTLHTFFKADINKPFDDCKANL